MPAETPTPAPDGGTSWLTDTEVRRLHDAHADAMVKKFHARVDVNAAAAELGAIMRALLERVAAVERAAGRREYEAEHGPSYRNALAALAQVENLPALEALTIRAADYETLADGVQLALAAERRFGREEGAGEEITTAMLTAMRCDAGHREEQHGTDNTDSGWCDTCNRLRLEKVIALSSLRSAVSPTIYVCPRCKKESTDRDDLIGHTCKV